MSNSPFPSSGSEASLHILVVDDMPEIREVLGLALAAEGHRVRFADCGRAAVRIIEVENIDVVVTDVLMPDGDGLEVIACARRQLMPPRVLAISGGGKYMTGTDCLRVARGLGADAVLMKPFNREQLLTTLESVRRSGAAMAS